jgi:hypothetical protein
MSPDSAPSLVLDPDRMEKLKENWLTDGLVDFEYKRYIVLAYLSHVKACFGKVELYPFLSDLVFHYTNLKKLRESKASMSDAFPKELSQDSLAKLEMTYKNLIEDDALMRELETIISFAIPEFKTSLDEGAQIYEYVEANCEISPVGLTSLYANEGYLFISQPPQRETDVYRYQITIFDHSNEMSRGLHMRFLRTTRRSLSNSYENIKLQLMREFAELPNPSVYLILSKQRFPYSETLVPIAKRLLIKQISKSA